MRGLVPADKARKLRWTIKQERIIRMALDRLTSINVFVQVAQSGGFSAAARRLGMSATMVSNHVQALEDRLGVRLLQRTTRRTSLTDIGQAYLDRARAILDELDEADRFAGALHATPRGQLRIYTNGILVPFLGPVVSDYVARHPEVSIDLRMGEPMVDLVEEGFDIAVRATPAPEGSPFIARRLTPFRHVPCCSPGFLQTHGAPKRPSDLARYNCIRYLYYAFGDEWRFENQNHKLLKVKIGGNIVTNSSLMIRTLALAGHGIVLVPSFLVADDIKAGRLIRLLPQYRPPELAILAIYPNRQHLSSKTRLFIDLLADRFDRVGAWMTAADTPPAGSA